jgi:N6-L-threonylcarbamoyladenine synthase
MLPSTIALGIETSCDDTSIAVLRGCEVLSSVVSSQDDLHDNWGGIVPEAAAREHLEMALPILETALIKAGVSLSDLELIGVTTRPGLVGALSVGASMAQALAAWLNVPVVGVNHLHAHLLSPLLSDSALAFPALGLLVSGGHTELVLMDSPNSFKIVAETRDDAAGETLDKCARLIGLPYPGGKELENLAKQGDARKYALPEPFLKDRSAFSFSGLKTAAARLVEEHLQDLDRASFAAGVQARVVEALVRQAQYWIDKGQVNTLTLSGGVAANRSLRQALQTLAERNRVAFVVAEPAYCTDNGAMIALAAQILKETGHESLDVNSRSLETDFQRPATY